MCACDRAGSASSSGSCRVARPIPIRQNASRSCTSLDVVTMPPPGRMSRLRRSTIRKWARQFTAKLSSRPSADSWSPPTVWMPALSARASIRQPPSSLATSSQAWPTEPRFARSASTMASRSPAPGKALSSSTRGEDPASKMTVQSTRSRSSIAMARRPMPLVPPSSPTISGRVRHGAGRRGGCASGNHACFTSVHIDAPGG